MSKVTTCDGCGAAVEVPHFQVINVTENGDSLPLDLCSKRCIALWLEKELARDEMVRQLIGAP